MANAATANRPVDFGKIAFLNTVGRDAFFLGQIGDRINLRVLSDSSLCVVVRSRVPLSLDWVLSLKLVVCVEGRFEMHEISHLSCARSRRVLGLITDRRRLLSVTEVFEDQRQPGAILFMAGSSARLVQASATL